MPEDYEKTLSAGKGRPECARCEALLEEWPGYIEVKVLTAGDDPHLINADLCAGCAVWMSQQLASSDEIDTEVKPKLN